MTRIAAVVVLLLLAPAAAAADVVLLLGEPYGRLGRFSPTGHAALYLTRVCAETPTVLRRCQEGETGVVVSRYHRVAGLDWIAVPLIPYLYAVEGADQVPSFASAEIVSHLRDTYRRARLLGVAPDMPDGAPPDGNWRQLVGATYDRRVLAFAMPTTTAQDDRLIDYLNARDNRSRFHFLFRNCADFAAELINLLSPGTVRANRIGDLGLATPKNVARSVMRRAQAEERRFLVPQVPGSRPQTQSARGVLEALVKTKKYAVPLAITQPWLPVALAAGYLTTGRFNPAKHALVAYEPAVLEEDAVRAASDGAGDAAGSEQR